MNKIKNILKHQLIVFVVLIIQIGRALGLCEIVLEAVWVTTLGNTPLMVLESRSFEPKGLSVGNEYYSTFHN